ncbi:phage repressor protein CI [Pectobacteriaceae bacterium CE90]|nr:phage repressor protein CI [Prodigiosinella sp. LS101]WJV52916.1 phage repressor protein CI [Prodigiosinella sp. LS101]WJV57271.1 phage repressor protein CI [Pectobacteriaceae bacterium C111]WJY16050.1 phage repressor protein CI [Pectobacteriaceae bacterium CE90]
MVMHFNTPDLVIPRMRSAYGVKNSVELARTLDIPASTLHNWTVRGSVPGNYIIQCSLETGSSLEWLVYGEVSNAIRKRSLLSGKSLYERILDTGGRSVLTRLMDAYGFKMQKELGELFDLSSGTISTWIRREHFPGDIVITCALDTGVSLRWLATGEGPTIDTYTEKKTDTTITDVNKSASSYSVDSINRIPQYTLINGKMEERGMWICDKSLTDGAVSPAYIYAAHGQWVIDMSPDTISNGKWLLDIDGDIDVYRVARIPGNLLKISGPTEFDCSIDDVKPVGKVFITLNK